MGDAGPPMSLDLVLLCDDFIKLSFKSRWLSFNMEVEDMVSCTFPFSGGKVGDSGLWNVLHVNNQVREREREAMFNRKKLYCNLLYLLVIIGCSGWSLACSWSRKWVGMRIINYPCWFLGYRRRWSWHLFRKKKEKEKERERGKRKNEIGSQ